MSLSSGTSVFASSWFSGLICNLGLSEKYYLLSNQLLQDNNEHLEAWGWGGPESNLRFLFVCSFNASRPFLDSQRARSCDDICTFLEAMGTVCGNDCLYKIAFNLKQQQSLLPKLCVC